MKTLPLVLSGVLLAVGAVLNVVLPDFFFGMSPDMLLTFMFLAILMFPKAKNVLVIGIATGVLAAITTSFPGGQIPNLVERPFTAFIVFGLFLLLRKNQSIITAAILTIVGTMISGTIFLSFALMIVGLPGGGTFLGFFIAVVLPAAAINAALMIIIHPIARSFKKRSKLASAA
ncbi:MAG TPA: tryptophan transporter [Bacillales bacterium]|nr:tryptophan transporter [Bacillales bacterium]